MSTTKQDCLNNAARARSVAQQMTTQRHRDIFTAIEAGWNALARERPATMPQCEHGDS